MNGHVDSERLREYVAGRLSLAYAASIEAHLPTCADCRAQLVHVADSDRLERTWSAIESRVDQPKLSVIERLLVRVGIKEHDARLVVGTPALRPAWLLAVAAVLTSAVVLDNGPSSRGNALYFFLVMAPLLPLAGVAAAFRPGADPAHELVVAAPKPISELLLARALAVLAITLLLTTAASLALPQQGWTVAAWLLPALGLTAATMALSTLVPAQWGGTGLALLWVTAASLALHSSRNGADAVNRFIAFRGVGQLSFAALTAVAVIVLARRRAALDFRRTL